MNGFHRVLSWKPETPIEQVKKKEKVSLLAADYYFHGQVLLIFIYHNTSFNLRKYQTKHTFSLHAHNNLGCIQGWNLH